MAKLLEPYGGGLQCDDPALNTFDIHGGGIDLVFPHHENEIAQSCCAFGAKRMANVWMHNGFLQVEGEKMSKSLGNFVTIRELLRRWNGRAWSGSAIRFAMLETRYQQPIDWTLDRLNHATEVIEISAASTAKEDFRQENSYRRAWYDAPVPSQAILQSLADDLNTPAALSHLRSTISNHMTLPDADRIQLVHDMRFLGFFHNEEQRVWLSGPPKLSEDTPSHRLLDGSAHGRDFYIANANDDVQFVAEIKGWMKSMASPRHPTGS